MAGTLGIAVAIILFIHEAYGASFRSSRGVTFAEFAKRTGVMRLVVVLTSSLLLLGSALLGIGDGAPRGWAGFLAVVVSVIGILMLPAAFRSISSLVGAASVHNLKRDMLVPRVVESVGRDLLTASMDAHLRAEMTDRGYTNHYPLTPASAAVLRVVRSGVVTDVRLKNLWACAAADPSVRVGIPLFSRVRAGSVVATSDVQCQLPDYLVVSPRGRSGARWDEFAVLKGLDEEASAAMRAEDMGRVEQSLELYELVVVTLLECDTALGKIGGMSVSGDTDLLVEVRRSLLRLHSHASAGGTADFDNKVLSATLSIAQAAIDGGNARVSAEFLVLSRMMIVKSLGGAA
ncbi:hypothetical protein ABLE68_19920 [Nocardioides sp. CN2-186]|uniref:hypothetical protein n=1 Tax=Nocardioides tweenelious TaxID=3156607 RepID=UPI0032B5D43F